MKLNIRPDNQAYSIEEKVKVENGQYKGTLKHDNVIKSSILVNTKPQLQGEYVNQYTITNPEEKEWETFINIYTKYDEVYISYETLGDQVDADDFNYLNEVKLEEKDLPDLSEIEQALEDLEVNKAEKLELSKLEKDINSKLEKLANSEDLDSVKNDLLTATNDISKLKINVSDINEKINILDLEKANKDEVQTQINNIVGDLNNALDEKVKELNSKIAKKVNQTEFNGLADKVNANDTKIQELEKGKVDIVELTKYLRIDGSDKEVTLGKGQMFETKFQNDNWSFINNYTGGGWARGLLNVKDKDSNNYIQIGANGGGQNFTRLYIGRAWDDWNLSINPNNSLVEVQGNLKLNNKEVALKEEIPTKVGELDNDKGYITKEEIPEVDLTDIEKNIADLDENKANKDHVHNTYLEKTGGNMTGTLNVKTPHFPVARFERETTASGNRYGAINLVRSGAKPVNGIGIGFYFKNNNSNSEETHSAFFGGALDNVEAGNEHGQLVFAPSYKGQDPYSRTDFTITALNSSESVSNFKGKLTLNNKEVSTLEHINNLQKQLDELDIPEGVDLTPVYEEINKLKETTLKTGGITCAELRGF